MKQKYLYLLIVIILSSCETSRIMTSNIYEDDLYYSPSEKPLSVKEMERNLTNDISINQLSDKQNEQYINTAKKIIDKNRTNYPDITNREVDNLAIKSVKIRKNPATGINDTIIEVINKGFWINGFKGSKADLDDAMNTIERFPLGFGYFGNGDRIGENLAFESDWNVYTRDGKYWWFPTFSNITFYSRNTFGTYPRYNEIVMWNNPNYEYWDYDYQYNSSGWYRNHRYRPFSYYSWGYSPFWYDSFNYDMFYPYNYGYYYPYHFGYYPYYYNNYEYNRNDRFIRDRDYNYNRASRDLINNTSINRTQPINRSDFGDPNARLKYRNTNYNKEAKRNTNYTRRTVKYVKPENTTRPSYNRSFENNSPHRESNSSSSTSNIRVRRR